VAAIFASDDVSTHLGTGGARVGSPTNSNPTPASQIVLQIGGERGGDALVLFSFVTAVLALVSVSRAVGVQVRDRAR
jgi:hypothetical protein